MLLYHELSNEVVDSLNAVHRNVGPGLLEKIYEGALDVELRMRGIVYERQKEYDFHYRGEFISTYYADLVIDNKIIIELKAVKELDRNMEAQLMNYLRISRLRVGYLVNFSNASLKFKRFII